MRNFFTDNEDLLFHFENQPLREIAAIQEEGFKEKDLYDYAPADAEDAVDSYRRILESTGEIAAEFIEPLSPGIDKEGNRLIDGVVVRPEGIRWCLEALSSAELMGFTLPRKYGGLNFPVLVYNMAIEIVSRADAALMNLFGLQGIADTVNAFASEEIKDKYLPRFASGEATAAMALTEPDAGSDLQSVKLQARQDETGVWRLTGVKRFITNGCAELMLVLARSEEGDSGGLGLSLFLCEQGEGIKIRRLEEKLGIHGSPTCEIQFDNAPAFLIGERRRGLVTYTMAMMNGARVGIAAQALGIAQAAFNESRTYAYTRRQFGKRIENLPPVAEMLAEMQTSLEGARALTYEACAIVDNVIGLEKRQRDPTLPDEQKREARKEQRQLDRLASLLTPMCKYYSTEMSVRVSSDAIQVLGGSGYMTDYPVERHYRDSRITNIYEGTSQLQVVAAYRGVLSGVAEKYFAKLAEGEVPKKLRPLARKLERARKLLADAIAYLKTRGGGDYTELYSRNLVDIAIDIMIGYLFLRDAQRSERKAILAKRFITRALPRVRMNRDLIRSGEKSAIRAFETIVGPPEI